MTFYPDGIDSDLNLPTVPGSSQEVSAINALRDAVVAIETELGIRPRGIYSDTSTRLSLVEGRANTGGSGGDGIIDAGTQLAGVVNIANGGTGLGLAGSVNTVLTSAGSTLLYKLIDNTNIALAAAIDGSKINPNFGSQTVAGGIFNGTTFNGSAFAGGTFDGTIFTGNEYSFSAGGPTITAGSGIPAGSEPNGSIFLRTDGASSTGLYTRQGGAWSVISSGGSFTAAGDLAGNSSSQTVVKLTGQSNILETVDPLFITSESGNKGGITIDNTTPDFDYTAIGFSGFLDPETTSSTSTYIGAFQYVGTILNDPAQSIGGDAPGYWLQAYDPVNARAVTALNIAQHTNFVISGARQYALKEDFGEGESVMFFGHANINPTTSPTDGIIMYVDASDGYLKYKHENGGVFTLNGVGTGGFSAAAGVIGGDGYIAFGTTPATDGYIRIPYNAANARTVIGAKASGGSDVSLLTFGAGDAMTVGNTSLDLSLRSFGDNTLAMTNGGFSLRAQAVSNVLDITNAAITTVVPSIAFATATSTPTISQADNTTSSATAQTLTLRSQNATGTTSTGGRLQLTSGTGTTAAGDIRFNIGSNLAGYFDGYRTFRAGIDASTNVSALGSVGLFPNNAGAPDSIYSYVASSFNQNVIASGSTTERALLYIINTGGGTNATAGVGVFAGGTSHATVEYIGNGIIEQIGASTSGLKFTKRVGNNTGFAATGTIWQSGAWSIGNATNNDTSSEAQAGLTGPLLNIGATTGGTLTSTANQALLYNPAGVVTLQGHAGHNFIINTTSVLSTASTTITVNVANLQFATAVTTPAIFQANNTTNGATAQVLTIRAQNATGTTSNGGHLFLAGGTGTSSNGTVRLGQGANTGVQITPTNSGTSTYQVVAGATAVLFQQATTTTLGATGATMTIQAQNSTNGATTVGGALTLTSGTGNFNPGNIDIQTGGTSRLAITPTVATFNLPTIQYGSTVVAPSINQADDATSSITGDTLTIRAQNATGTTSTGGDLTISSGTGTAAHGDINFKIGGNDALILTGVNIPGDPTTPIEVLGSRCKAWYGANYTTVGTAVWVDEVGNGSNLSNSVADAPDITTTPGGNVALNFNDDALMGGLIGGLPDTYASSGYYLWSICLRISSTETGTVYDDPGTGNVDISSGNFDGGAGAITAIPNNTWVVLTSVTNSATNALTLYKDNVQVATSTRNFGSGWNDGAPTTNAQYGRFIGTLASVVYAQDTNPFSTDDLTNLYNSQLEYLNGTPAAAEISAIVKITDSTSDGNEKVSSREVIKNLLTDDATPDNIFTWTITDNAVTTIDALITAITDDGYTGASYKRTVTFRRVNGTVTTIGLVSDNMTEEDSAPWDVDIDNSSSTGRVRVTGEASTDIQWGLFARLQTTIY